MGYVVPREERSDIRTPPSPVGKVTLTRRLRPPRSRGHRHTAQGLLANSARDATRLAEELEVHGVLDTVVS